MGEAPEFYHLERHQDGTADWKANFDALHQHFNAARGYFQNRYRVDILLIEFLVSKRLRAKRAGNFALADEIRQVLGQAGVDVADDRDGSNWRIVFSTEGGRVAE